MNTIYETKGRAREYNELALNLYRGCGHRCRYCYAPDVLKMDREDYGQPQPRKGIIEALKLAVQTYEMRGEKRHILMSFSCDPYQQLDEKLQLTRQAIQIIKEAGLRVSILTKGGNRALRDLDLLTSLDQFGTTLTLFDGDQKDYWEPNAAPTYERMQALNEAHGRGIPTWVSLEPVIDPGHTLDIIRETHKYVEKYKVGVMNYVDLGIDWGLYARTVKDLLDELGCSYYLKKDLQKWLTGGATA